MRKGRHRAILFFVKTASKKLSGAAYVGIQADMAARDGAVSAKLADLFFQCACIQGERVLEEWDRLVVQAMEANVTVQDVLTYGEDS